MRTAMREEHIGSLWMIVDYSRNFAGTENPLVTYGTTRYEALESIYKLQQNIDGLPRWLGKQNESIRKIR